MAVLAVQDASAGLASVTFTAAAGGGDSMAQGTRAGGWDTGVFLLVRNTDAGTPTVTVAGMAPVVVPATTGIAVIPVYGGYRGSSRAITYSAVTNLSVAAIALANG